MAIVCVALDCLRRRQGRCWALASPQLLLGLWLLCAGSCTPEFHVSLSFEGKGHLPDFFGLSWVSRQEPRCHEQKKLLVRTVDRRRCLPTWWVCEHVTCAPC